MGFICVEEVNNAIRICFLIRDIAIAAVTQNCAAWGAPGAKIDFQWWFSSRVPA